MKTNNCYKGLFRCLLVCCAIVVFCSSTQSATSVSPFQVRLVVDNPGPNTEEITYHGAKNDETFYVEKAAVLDHSDVKSAVFDKGKENSDTITYGILLTLTSEGSKHYSKFTQTHIGSKVAVFLSGKYIITRVIGKPIDYGKFQFVVAVLSKPEVEEEIRRINDAIKRP